MRFLSYNLHKCAAVSELPGLAAECRPDVLCVQECESDGMPGRLGDLTLGGNTSDNRLGLAVYVREESLSVIDSQSFALKRSLHERIFSPADERLLVVHLRESGTGRGMLVGSFHGAPLTASNGLRRQQIDAAHARMREVGGEVPTLMVGDFNYPLFTGGLVKHLAESGYELTRSTTRTYQRYGVLAGRFDVVTSSGFHVGHVDVLRKGASDHHPILFEAEPAHLEQMA